MAVMIVTQPAPQPLSVALREPFQVRQRVRADSGPEVVRVIYMLEDTHNVFFVTPRGLRKQFPFRVRVAGTVPLRHILGFDSPSGRTGMITITVGEEIRGEGGSLDSSLFIMELR